MPAYNSQAASNSPLVSVGPEDPAPAVVLNAEIPAANQASLAVAIRPGPVWSGTRLTSVLFLCPGGIGAGAFQIQEADEDVNSSYTSINFGGATPGVVNAAAMSAAGTAKVTLQIRTRFLRVLCTASPGAAVTVKVSG